MKRILALIILALLINPTAAPAQLKRIAVAYSAISATQAGFYLAKDAAIFDDRRRIYGGAARRQLWSA